MHENKLLMKTKQRKQTAILQKRDDVVVVVVVLVVVANRTSRHISLTLKYVWFLFSTISNKPSRCFFYIYYNDIF